jgi:tripartite ATP-independent transporter DctM subunit
MSAEATGVAGIAVLIFLFLLRVPIAFAMALVGFGGFALLSGMEPALAVLSQDFFDTFTSYPLSVIPMFVLMGAFAHASGISERLFATAHAWVGSLRGGLTIATVLACAGFAAICGSTAATAAAMGRIALPAMKKYRYDDTLATGAVASAGTLGILIPPSTVLIVYAILTQESIGKLFIAGIVPGIILSLMFVAVVALLCARNPELGPQGPATTWREKLKATRGIAEAVVLFLLAIGGLMLGWFSPNQAGAIGAGGALLIGIARRRLTWRRFVDTGREGLVTSAMILFIIAGAVVFGHFLAVSTLPIRLAEWVGGLEVHRMVVMAIIIVIYFLGGFFMDSMALIVVTIPIFFPVVQKLGFDPIWFGVIVVLVAEMGVITPPVGVNVFVIKSIAPEIPLGTIFRGIFPFLYAIILLTAIVMFVPQIATFLPQKIG